MSSFRKALAYLAKYKLRFIGSLFFAAIAAATSPSLGFMTKPLIDDVLSAKSVANINLFLVVIIALCAIKGITTAASRYMMLSIGAFCSYELRKKLYDHMVKLPMSFFERNKTGQIMARSTTDVPVVRQIMIQLHHCVVDIFRVLFSLAALIWVHTRYTLTLFVIVPPMAFFIRFVSNRMRSIGKRIQERLGDINASLQETILGIREIKAFSAESKECERFDQINRSNLKNFLKGAKYRAITVPSLEIFIAVAMSFVFYFGARLVLQGELSTGWFVAYVTVLGQLFDPLRRLVDVFNNIKISLAAFDRVFLLLEEPVTISDLPGAIELQECKGLVEFKNVTFSYDSNTATPDEAGQDCGESDDVRGRGVVLKNISLVAEPGQVVAFVGPSGAGKTTLVSLLPRFYDIEHGEILIDGTNIRNFTLKSLRRQFGIVPQETILFSGTVAENIAFGKPRATPDEIEQAARDANAHEFIELLPDGYATQIGERGTKLSGGQRQRIAIARAILKNPRILILDEATSSLDTDSEQLVQEALERLMVNRTTFIIAHRLSTVTRADKIIVLENGVICEVGNHSELLEQKAVYYRLCQAQFQAA